ncbi:MAG: hypothetical protein IJS00_04340 [Paludibacteraceae bacterium]|nr:hypothetical protein [Paludibacteraceae bacterium]
MVINCYSHDLPSKTDIGYATAVELRVNNTVIHTGNYHGSFYGLRDRVVTYMRDYDLTYCTVQLTADGNTVEEYNVLYADYSGGRQNHHNGSDFLSNITAQRIPYNAPFLLATRRYSRITLHVLTGIEHVINYIPCIEVVFRDPDTEETESHKLRLVQDEDYTFDEQQGIYFINTSLDRFYQIAMEENISIDERLEPVEVHIAQSHPFTWIVVRDKTFYLSDDDALNLYYYRNCYNCWESVAFPGALERKREVKEQIAELYDRTLYPYRKEVTDEYTLHIPAMFEQEEIALRELIASRMVIEANGLPTHPDLLTNRRILILDSDCYYTTERGALLKGEIRYRYTNPDLFPSFNRYNTMQNMEGSQSLLQ